MKLNKNKKSHFTMFVFFINFAQQNMDNACWKGWACLPALYRTSWKCTWHRKWWAMRRKTKQNWSLMHVLSMKLFLQSVYKSQGKTFHACKVTSHDLVNKEKCHCLAEVGSQKELIFTKSYWMRYITGYIFNVRSQICYEVSKP